MLKKSKMTGKYSSGNSNKSDCISQECVITRKDGDKIDACEFSNRKEWKIFLEVGCQPN